MTTLKPRHAAADVLAVLAWAAMVLTPVGWFYGALAVGYSHLGDVTDVSMMTGGIVLFAAAPTSAFIAAVYAARAGHRSGTIAMIVSGLLLLATIVATLLFNGEAWPASPGWIGVAVAAVIAVLVLVWVLSRRVAVVVSGLLLLATLAFSGWETGGWINVAVIAVMAVVVVLASVWARSRKKPPAGPDGHVARGGSADRRDRLGHT